MTARYLLALLLMTTSAFCEGVDISQHVVNVMVGYGANEHGEDWPQAVYYACYPPDDNYVITDMYIVDGHRFIKFSKGFCCAAVYVIEEMRCHVDKDEENISGEVTYVPNKKFIKKKKHIYLCPCDMKAVYSQVRVGEKVTVWPYGS